MLQRSYGAASAEGVLFDCLVFVCSWM